jgi:hypothetical protein
MKAGGEKEVAFNQRPHLAGGREELFRLHPASLAEGAAEGETGNVLDAVLE